jgi:beta-lactamase regulating signal transducer with metallopeptidase domain
MNELELFLGPDPVAGLFAAVLAVNVVLAATILIVAFARLPVRHLLGPAAAYQLWFLPPIVALPTLFLVTVPHETSSEPAVTTASITANLAAGLPQTTLLVPLWALGAIVMAVLFAAAQARFMAEVRAGRGGPAVVGLIAPRVILPADDGHYTAQERELIRAHEREHVARKDPRGAAFVALFQCLCWFNPFAHLAAHLLRLDQELACDAAVVMRRPGSRGLYARTLLKTQLAGAPLPFGCHWGQHPLEVRIAALKRRPDRGRVSGAGGPTPVDAIRP